MANPTLARLSDRALDAVMAIAEVPLNFIERLIGKRRMPYIFLMPNLVLFGIFTFLPIAIAVGYAFTGGTELLITDRPFVGLENFGKLLDCQSYMDPGSCRESLFWTAIWNTLWFVGFNVIATLLVALSGHPEGSLRSSRHRCRLAPAHAFAHHPAASRPQPARRAHPVDDPIGADI